MKTLGIVIVSVLLAASPALLSAQPQDSAGDQTPMMRGLGVGTHFGRGPNWDVDTVLPLLKQMGVSVIRDGPEWAGIEQTKGHYIMVPECQRWFDAVTKSGIRVVLVLMRKNTLYDNPLDPDAFARWAAYMAKTWKSPQVCAYEIWNEPPNFDFPQQYGRRSSAWLPKYCEMVRKAAAAIREVNPHAVILQNVETRQWLSAIADHSADFAQIDGIDLHPYPKSGPAESSPYGPPVTDAQHSMQSYLTIQAFDYPKKYLGHELQAWVGEYGFPTMAGRGGQWHGVTEAQQAAYEVRGLLVGLHAGVKAWCIYDMVNEGTDPTDNEDNMGLVRDITHNHQPKPAFYSLQRVARLMGPDWQMAPGVQAKLDMSAAPDAGAKPSLVEGPQALWFRVGKDALTFIWNAGKYVDQTAPPLGTITWSNAPDIASVEVQDLVTGQKVSPTLSRAGAVATLAGVPVGSNPVAIRWIAAK